MNTKNRFVAWRIAGRMDWTVWDRFVEMEVVRVVGLDKWAAESVAGVLNKVWAEEKKRRGEGRV